MVADDRRELHFSRQTQSPASHAPDEIGCRRVRVPHTHPATREWACSPRQVGQRRCWRSEANGENGDVVHVQAHRWRLPAQCSGDPRSRSKKSSDTPARIASETCSCWQKRRAQAHLKLSAAHTSVIQVCPLTECPFLSMFLIFCDCVRLLRTYVADAPPCQCPRRSRVSFFSPKNLLNSSGTANWWKQSYIVGDHPHGFSLVHRVPENLTPPPFLPFAELGASSGPDVAHPLSSFFWCEGGEEWVCRGGWVRWWWCGRGVVHECLSIHAHASS